jgi:uncharacterized protein (TIGR03437 family)
MYPRIQLLGRLLSPVMALMLSPSLWAQTAPAFQTSSLARIVRIEGLAELAGSVNFSVTNAPSTIPAGSALALGYSAPISATASDNGSNSVVTCTIGGVLGACPSYVTVQPVGNNVFIGFASSLAFTQSGDGLSVSQVRLNVTGLSSGAQVMASISGGPTGAFTVTQSQLPVVSGAFASLNPSASTFGGSQQAAAACAPPGNAAMTFSVSVTEGVPDAFSTVGQETGALAATSGGNLEVLLSNVPAGVTIQPASTIGSTNTLVFATLPAAITQVNTGTMLFSFPFSSTNTSSVETAVVNFNIGFTSPIALSQLVGPITARARIGPVSTAATSPPLIVSFIDNTAVSGTAFSIVPCALFPSITVPIKDQTFAGNGPMAIQSVEIYEQFANLVSFSTTTSTTSGGNWLSVSPTGGQTPSYITLYFDATNLSPGTYNGQVMASAVGATPTVIQAQIVVTAAVPTIALSPNALVFNGFAGGTNSTQNINISNSGTGTFNWTMMASTANGGNWLSVSPASGTGSVAVTATANIAGLAVGTYTGAIQVASTGATNTPQTIPVTLTLTAPPTIAPSPQALSFTAAVGANPGSQTLQINNSGSGVLGVTVTAATSSGGNWLSVTPNTGTAPLTLSVAAAASSLAQGNYQGTITIAATPGSGSLNSPQTVGVTLAVGTPGISGVVNAASYVPNASITPGSIGAIFGGQLAASTTSAAAQPLPTTLAGTQVFLNGVSGIACPLFYVSPGQINFEMPVQATASTATLTVVSGGLSSLQFVVNSGAVYPAIFTSNGAGSGPAAALNADYSSNSASNPTPAGGGILLYLTGLGATNPAVATGQAGASSAPLDQTLVTPTVMINGVAANVGFSGLAPTFVGLYQLNVTIPQGTPSGLVNVQVIAGGVTSNTVQIAVK